MRGEEALTSREINPVLQGNAIKFYFENEYLKDLEAIAKKRACRARTLVGDDDRAALPLLIERLLRLHFQSLALSKQRLILNIFASTSHS
jgi:hypothetical protein